MIIFLWIVCLVEPLQHCLAGRVFGRVALIRRLRLRRVVGFGLPPRTPEPDRWRRETIYLRPKF